METLHQSKPEKNPIQQLDEKFAISKNLENLSTSLPDRLETLKKSTLERLKLLLPANYTAEKFDAAVALAAALDKIPHLRITKIAEAIKKANLEPVNMRAMAKIMPALLGNAPLNSPVLELTPVQFKKQTKEFLMDMLGTKEYIKKIITPLIRKMPLDQLKLLFKEIAPYIPESYLRSAIKEVIKGMSKQELLELAKKDANWLEKFFISLGGAFMSEKSVREKALNKIDAMSEEEIRKIIIDKLDHMTEQELQDLIINNLSDKVAEEIAKHLSLGQLN